MSDSIWIHYARPRSHWYRLSAGQKQEKQAQWQEIAKAASEQGAQLMGQYHIRGQHDFQTVEIWHFSSAEAAFDYWNQLTAASYNEWFAFSNNVGLSLETPIYEHASS